MTPEQFAYWLQGFIELNGGTLPTAVQWKSIKEHLAQVFTKVTPPVEVKPVEPIAKSTYLSVEEKKLKDLLEELKRDEKDRRDRRRPVGHTCYPGRIC